MGNFRSTDIPAWRLVLWGVATAIGVISLGFYSSGKFDYHLCLGGLLAGTFCSGLGFSVLWAARSRWLASHAKLLLVFYIAGQVVLFIWTLVERKK